MILLYNPESTTSDRKPLPMSLLAAASLIEDQEVRIIDGNLEADPIGKLLAYARESTPTAIGLTVMPGPQLTRATLDSRRLKEELPEVPIVWGGYFPSQHADAVLADPAIDLVVHGQGEVTMKELAETLRTGGDVADLAGVIYRDGDGQVKRNPKRPLVSLDELPDWPYDLVPMDRYIQKHYLGDRVGHHSSSFGCPFACSFCAVVEMVNRKWFAQSPERTASVVEHFHRRWNIDAMQFHDMDFFISESRTKEIAERIAPLGIRWWALGRVDELMRYKTSTWEAMQKSGLQMVFCGAETGSEEALEQMNKGGKSSPELTLDLVRRMKEYGVVPELSFVLGLPPEPEKDVDRTLTFIRKIKEVNPETEVILYLYTPVPLDGTLWEEARAQGFTYPETLDGWISGDWQQFALRRDPSTPWRHSGVQTRVRNFERVLNAYYPTVTDKRLTGMRRTILKTLAGWRYAARFYTFPLELRVLQRLFRYQRPETTGF